MKDVIPRGFAELQEWRRWVVWKPAVRDDKPTKLPYQPARPSQMASSTDDTTWGTYEQAQAAVERGRAHGVGYVFAPDDEYCGIDLDKCIEPAEGAFGAALGPTVREPARRFVTELDSYTELSPSGTGLHVIVRGRLTVDHNKTNKTPWGGSFEIYDSKRFFTMTGEHLTGAPDTIKARQAEIDRICAEMFPPPPNGNGKPRFVAGENTLDDRELEEKIRSSKQAADFDRLMAGDTSGHSGDDSSADLALCNILAFWFGPSPARVDSMFRRSGLMRDKWDASRGERTYGAITIAKALEGRTEFFVQGKPRSRPADDDVEMSPGEEMSRICGLIDDPFASGWRPSRQAKSRIVLTTRAARVLDLESWKAATSTPRTLAQEIRLQLGVDVTLTKEGVNRLDVLVGKFCELVEATAVRDRAWQIGMEFLHEAEQVGVDMADQASRYAAFERLRATRPAVRSKAENVSFVEACIVLVDVTGKRYVRVQWFVDYVKASAVSGTATAILEHMEAPGWWSKPNAQGRFMATDPASGRRASQILFEVPAEWEEG